MMRISRILSGIFLAAVVTHGIALASPSPAEATLHAFYAWLLEHPGASLPSIEERKQLESIVSPSLLASLSAASAMEDQCERAVRPGDKPYVLEGAIFTGIYEGAHEVSYGSARKVGNALRFEVMLVHTDSRFSKAHQYRTSVWRNEIELHQFDWGWRVSNVFFEKNQSLSRLLNDYIVEGKRECRLP